MDAQSHVGHSGSDEGPMQSTSIAPSQHLLRSDEEILPQQNYAAIKINNQYVDLNTFKMRNPIMQAILRAHSICPLLTRITSCPNIYLQQFWYTVKYIAPEGRQPEYLEFTIDNDVIQMRQGHFRSIIGHPTKNEQPNHRFELPDESESDILQRLMHLGYQGHISLITQIRRKQISGVWNTLFGLLLPCLTTQTGGLDKCNRSFAQLFDAFVHGRHIDYSRIIWNDLVTKVQKKPSFILYIRFLQMVVRRSMDDSNGSISERPIKAAPYVPHKLQYLQIQEVTLTAPHQPIPWHL